MADKIVVMNHGNVEQLGRPLAIYDDPSNMFVAGFIGSPAMNFINGKVADGSVTTDSGGIKLPIDAPLDAYQGREVVYGIRPEHLELAEDGVEAQVVVVEPTGSETQLFVRLADQEVVAVFRDRYDPHPGDIVKLRPRGDAAMLFDRAGGARLQQ